MKRHKTYPSCIPQADQYAKWMAACRLASKGKTMADSTYNTELQSIQAFLAMQQGQDSVTPTMPTDVPDFQPENFVSQRYLKKYKRNQVRKPYAVSFLGFWFCVKDH